MSEILINAISTVRAAELPGVLARAPVPVQAEPPSGSAAKPVASIDEKVSASKSVESAPVPLVGNASNVALQFRVDAKTKDVTVFVVDRNSKKVLRSIPATELAKLQAGDLLKLTA
jgi:hypothetical protein